MWTGSTYWDSRQVPLVHLRWDISRQGALPQHLRPLSVCVHSEKSLRSTPETNHSYEGPEREPGDETGEASGCTASPWVENSS